MITQGRTKDLRTLELFADVGTEDLARLEVLADRIDVAPGDVLATEGESGRHVFVVLAGRADVTRRGVRIGEVGPGALIGDLALLDFGPHWATVVASTHASLLVLGPTAFRTALGLPGVTYRLLREQIRRLRSTA